MKTARLPNCEHPRVDWSKTYGCWKCVLCDETIEPRRGKDGRIVEVVGRILPEVKRP